MRLRDIELLVGYMAREDMSQARLGRFADCSRQFVHMLITGERTTCTPEVAARIEEALGVLPSTLFAPSVSPVRGRGVAAVAASRDRKPVSKVAGKALVRPSGRGTKATA